MLRILASAPTWGIWKKNTDESFKKQNTHVCGHYIFQSIRHHITPLKAPCNYTKKKEAGFVGPI
jgi:hypothetical protein